jgi:predicted transposase/invertase (TIGR01784 family)
MTRLSYRKGVHVTTKAIKKMIGGNTMKQVASLRYDTMFKKAFSDPEIFRAFAQDFLNIELEIDEVIQEKTFSPPIGNVKVRFDLFAEDRKHRTIIDIQHERYPDHYHRFLHYQCAALLELAANFQEYRPRLNVFTLVVLTSGDRYKRDISILNFDPQDLKGKRLGEIPHKIIHICPKYVTDDTPEPYREWMRAIVDSLDEEVDETQYTRTEILKMFDYIEKDHITPEERARMFDEYGQEAMVKKALMKEKRETARKMLKNGLDISLIARCTGLSDKEVMASQQEHPEDEEV